MNRFGTYLSSMKLAKMLLTQAEDKYNHKDERAALRDTIKSLQHFITSMNCLASLAYEPRKKHKVKASKAQRVVKVQTDIESNKPSLPSEEYLEEENYP